MDLYIDWELHTPVGKWIGRAIRKEYRDILTFAHKHWKRIDELCIPLDTGEVICIGIECLRNSVLYLKEVKDE